MTVRRMQVLEALTEGASRGEVPTLSNIARRLNLYDYRDVRRIRDDLRAMGAI